jgi:S-(hydroxymethyl)glutathione dehydrogenase/alcohol dehydrogenase
LRAAVLHAFDAPLRVEEIETDPPGPDEALVRFAASGVCHSDLHTARGIHPTPLPAVLGHEGAGVVEAVGPRVETAAPGDHVIVTWLPACGRCRFCAQGRPNLCDRMDWSGEGLMADGTTRFRGPDGPIHHYGSVSSFAEAAVVPAQTLIPVDPALPLADMALMGCAVMTGVGAVLNTARVRPGQHVAVVGCGGVGLSIVQGARIAGAGRIVAIDVQPEKLELAAELGATETVDAGREDPLERLAGGVDVSFEALGRPETIETAIGLTGKGGTAVLVGMAPPDARIAVDALSLTLGERSIKGCWYGSCRPAVDYPLLVELYARGELRLDPMRSRTCSLDDVNDALERVERGEGARTVILYE